MTEPRPGEDERFGVVLDELWDLRRTDPTWRNQLDALVRKTRQPYERPAPPRFESDPHTMNDLNPIDPEESR